MAGLVLKWLVNFSVLIFFLKKTYFLFCILIIKGLLLIYRNSSFEKMEYKSNISTYYIYFKEFSYQFNLILAG